ncbi:MAG: family 10 glycosylhydrolase, partial [Cyanothece sp. SIO1E1]|nr:family 10 glycosylhydrolase [Cyanothece sp. SIO1E1]
VHDPDWMRWRADKLTKVWTQIFHTVKASNPKCLVALSPNHYQFAYDTSLQDWQNWRQRGFIEELMVQVYRNNLDSFAAELDRPEMEAARAHIPVGIGILAGLKSLPVPIPLIQAQVQTARERGFAGVSFFFYETLWRSDQETLDQRRTSLQQLFPTSVKRPIQDTASPVL